MDYIDALEVGPIAIASAIVSNECVEEAMQSMNDALIKIPGIVHHISIDRSSASLMIVRARIKSTQSDLSRATHDLTVLAKGILKVYPAHKNFSIDVLGATAVYAENTEEEAEDVPV